MALIGLKQLDSPLTGSLQVSGSSGVTGSINVSGDATVGGDVKVAQYIKHEGNETTFINFTSNRIRFKAGDIGFLDMEKDASTPYPLTVNQGGNRVNFRVVDRNTDLLLKTDSEEFNVKLYHAGNEKLLTKSDGIEVLGNVSGSATSTGSFGRVEAVGVVHADSFESVTGGNTIDFNDDIDVSGHITASGNISGSSTSTGSFGNVHVDKKLGIGTLQPTHELEVRGDVGINQYIYHNDDDDTRINFTSDRIKIELGGTEFLDARNTSQDFVTIGGSGDIDAKLEGGDGYVFVQGSDGFVGIKDDTPTHQLDVAGTGRFTGQLNVNSDLVVDGKIVAQEFHTEFVSASIQYSSGSTQFGNTEDDTHTFSGSISLNSGTTKEFSISGSGLLSGSFATSASFGRIDTSGDIYSSGRIFEQNTSVIDHATAMAIVFGG